MPCSRILQRIASGRARTRNPSISNQALSHCSFSIIEGQIQHITDSSDFYDFYVEFYVFENQHFGGKGSHDLIIISPVSQLQCLTIYNVWKLLILP